MQNLAKTLKSEFHRSRNAIFVVFVFFMAAAFTFIATSNMRSSHAANAYDFRAGNIISDAVMSNYNAMSLSEIQAFLDSKNRCDNRNYDEYLEMTNRWPHIQWHWEGEPYNGHFVCLAQERFGNTPSEIGAGQTAAEIIYEAAQANRINPQVLLVLLQKETSLITDKIPNSLDYSKATGYGCPDTAACDTKYSGFKNQVNRAAELFRYTLDYGSTTYPEGRNVYVGYNPASSCGGTQIFIENRATASLYRYTPYQPNSAALAAGYGYGDGCSAYGNRNFFLYFTDWFGSTQEIKIDGELVSIPNGIYSIMPSSNKDRTVGIANNYASITDGTKSDRQRWSIVRNEETGYYTLTDLHTNKMLSTAATTVNTNSKLILSDTSGCNSQWRIYRTTDQSFIFESVCARGMVLDTNNGTLTIGTNIEMYPADGTETQKWSLHVGQTIADDTYVVYSKLHTNRVIDVSGLAQGNGANLQLWEHYGEGYQELSFTYEDATDSYIITSPQTRRSVEVTGASTHDGANVQLWTEYGTCGHRWKVVEDYNGDYTLVSTCSNNKVIDVANSQTAMGTNLRLWESNNTKAQRWTLEPVSGYSRVSDGVYVITSKAAADRAIDVAGLGKENNTNVWLWEEYSEGAQKWQVSFDPLTNDYVIRDLHSNKPLTANNYKVQKGDNVNISSAKSDCSARWRFRPVEDGYYEIVSSCYKDRIIDIAGATTGMGTNVWLWSSYNYPTQQWSLLKQ